MFILTTAEESRTRRYQLDNNKIVPRWRYILDKLVPDIKFNDLTALIKNGKSLIPNIDLLSLGVGGINNNCQNGGDGGHNNKFNNLAKIALSYMLNLGSIGSLPGNGKGDGNAAGGNYLNKLNDMTKKAYDR